MARTFRSGGFHAQETLDCDLCRARHPRRRLAQPARLAEIKPPEQLADKYATLAGSEANAKVLVKGLRDGSDFAIGGTTFDPPTHKMGNGEVNIALSLAEAKLKQQGITNPTPAQLQAALIGDAQHPGVLTLRAEGKGWGYIAHTMGLKLGDVMRAEKAERHERHERMARNERPDKPEKPEHHGR